MEALSQKKVIEELRAIRKDIEFIKKHMIDIDMILTRKEEKILEESIREYEKGKTTKLEDLEKEMRE